jgi:hypothetical protein
MPREQHLEFSRLALKGQRLFASCRRVFCRSFRAKIAREINPG